MAHWWRQRATRQRGFFHQCPRQLGSTVGYLASVRNVSLHVARLDDLEADLIAAAERVTGDGRTVLYEFSVWSAQQPLVSGRASVVFTRTHA